MVTDHRPEWQEKLGASVWCMTLLALGSVQCELQEQSMHAWACACFQRAVHFSIETAAGGLQYCDGLVTLDWWPYADSRKVIVVRGIITPAGLGI